MKWTKWTVYNRAIRTIHSCITIDHVQTAKVFAMMCLNEIAPMPAPTTMWEKHERMKNERAILLEGIMDAIDKQYWVIATGRIEGKYE